jgi:hypothetical protein
MSFGDLIRAWKVLKPAASSSVELQLNADYVFSVHTYTYVAINCTVKLTLRERKSFQYTQFFLFCFVAVEQNFSH